MFIGYREKSIFDTNNDTYSAELKRRLQIAFTYEYLSMKNIMLIYFWSIYNRKRYFAFMLQLMDERKGFMAFDFAKNQKIEKIESYLASKTNLFIAINKFNLKFN